MIQYQRKITKMFLYSEIDSELTILNASTQVEAFKMAVKLGKIVFEVIYATHLVVYKQS